MPGDGRSETAVALDFGILKKPSAWTGGFFV